MQQHIRKIAFSGSFGRLILTHQFLCDRQDHVLDPRIHKVLEEYFLRAFFLMDSRIVGQVVRHRLIAVTQVTGPERRIHDFHRRNVTALGRTVFRRQRQRILNVGDILLVLGKPFAFCIVADENSRAIGRFHT